MTGNDALLADSPPEVTEAQLAHLERKFVTERTPERFKARVLALYGTMTKAAINMETEPRTFRRWCNGTSVVPGVAWGFLAALEREQPS